MRTNEGSESSEKYKGLKMVLKCDKLVKEERLKCMVENRIHKKRRRKHVIRTRTCKIRKISG